MAAKKKAKAKTKVSKKKTSKKRAGGGRIKDPKKVILYFMGQLIAAGYVGEEIPEESSERNHIAVGIRQMAEKLARQVRKFGGEGEDGSDDEDAEEGEEAEIPVED
jgi:hypothetical protein